MLNTHLISPLTLLCNLRHNKAEEKQAMSDRTYKKYISFPQRLKAWLMRIWLYEFWPGKYFYFPTKLYAGWLAIKYGKLTYPTLANPSIYSGGMVGESKVEILGMVDQDLPHILKYHHIAGDLSLAEKTQQFKAFIKAQNLSYPIILKPDQGQRGGGVRLIHDEAQAIAYLEEAFFGLVIQEYCDYEHEAGVFYVREPGQESGYIYSMTEKVFPYVTGDGTSTIAQLILADKRAWVIWQTYFKRFADTLDHVPAAGEKIRLVESGNHCQGTIFEDGFTSLVTPELTKSLDAIVDTMDEFYVGRFDVRYKTNDDLRRGTFKIIEINGASAEATHVYDKKLWVWQAYAALFGQWDIMFKIGKMNAQRGYTPMTFREFMKSYKAFLKQEESYSQAS